MQFFKKMGSGSGEKASGKSNLFGGMKIKGPVVQTKQKPSVVQSQTSFNIVTKKEEEIKQRPFRQTEDYDRPDETFKRKAERRGSEFTNDQKAQKQQQKYQAINRQNDQIAIQRKSSEISTSKHSQDAEKQQSSVTYDNNDTVTEKSEKSVPEKRLNPMLAQLKKTLPKQPKQQKEEKKQQIQKPTQDKPIVKKQKSDKEIINEQLTKTHLKHIQLFQKQKQAKQRTIQLHSRLQTMKQQLTLSTKRQCNAVQKEEYELADKLQSEIQTLTIKMSQLQQQKKHAQSLLHQLQYDQLAQLKTSWGDNKRLVRKIKMVELQIAEQISVLEREQGEKIQQDKNKNQNEKKKLARLNLDIKSQSQQLAEYTKKVNEDKQCRIHPLEDQRVTLESGKQTLEKEIKQLQALLKAKKSTLSQAVQALKQINNEIKQIEDSFKQQESQILKQKHKLRELQSQSQQFENRVRSLQKKIEQEISALQERTQELNKEAELISTVAKDIECKSSVIEDTIQQRRVKLDTFIHNEKALHSFEQMHKGSKQKIKELQFTKANIVSQVAKYQDRKKEIKSRIPILENQQKTMAAAKNFKAAGLKKTEIKQLQQQIDEIAKKIEANFIEQKSIEEQIADIQNQQEKYLDQQNQIKKNLAISQYKFSVEKVQAIVQQLQWLHNSKVQNKKVLIQLLNSQLQQLNLQLDYIGQQYQLSEHKKISSQLDSQKIVIRKKEAEKRMTVTAEKNQLGEQKVIQFAQNGVRDKIQDQISKQIGSPNMLEQRSNEQNSTINNMQQPVCNNQQSNSQTVHKQQDPTFNQQKEQQKNEQQQQGYVPIQID